ncbi:MAG: leucine-rich repeat domain-containing protein [Bacteroidales bacterium]|jgi:hypothetical protein|nr:leucine-rich repeat domain-containing protein [Bacteroidales bacterium]
MKEISRITQLTLELYHLGAVTRKERKLVEAALLSDSELYTRYKELQKIDKELQQLQTVEKSKVFTVIKNDNMQKSEINLFSGRKKILWGVGIAAVLFCVFIPSFIYFKGRSSDSRIASVTEQDVESEINVEIEQSITLENEDNTKDTERVVINETRVQELGIQNNRQNEPARNDYIAVVPEQETGIYTRGGDTTQEQNTIPETVTFIFDSMFANRQLTSVTIPERVTFIGDNAFANNQIRSIVIPRNVNSIGSKAFDGNPLTRITIGENVYLDEDAIPGNFANVYTNYGKTSGTYTRTDIYSNWRKN